MKENQEHQEQTKIKKQNLRKKKKSEYNVDEFADLVCEEIVGAWTKKDIVRNLRNEFNLNHHEINLIYQRATELFKERTDVIKASGEYIIIERLESLYLSAIENNDTPQALKVLQELNKVLNQKQEQTINVNVQEYKLEI